MKIKTTVLQDMINKAGKICKKDALSPITLMVQLERKGNNFIVTTTSGDASVIIRKPVEGEGEDFRAVVYAEFLTSLVNKITTEYVDMKIEGNNLSIIGNGAYLLDICVDDNGDVIKFPEFKEVAGDGKEIDVKKLIDAISVARSCTAINMNANELDTYYIGKKIIATNTYKVGIVPNIPELENEDIYLPKELGNALVAIGFDKAKIKSNETTMELYNDEYVFQATINGAKDKFPTESALSMLQLGFDYNVTLNKNELLQVLERAALFIKDYERNGISFIFRPDKLTIRSLSGAINEDLEYISKDNVEGLVEVSTLLDILNLKDQLSSLTGEKVTMGFGGYDGAVRLSQDGIVEIHAVVDVEN